MVPVKRDSKQDESGPEGTTATGVTVKPVVNTVKILLHLTYSGTPERAADIARELGINPSTCFNILRTLAAEDMLAFDPLSKTYTPGLELAKLVQHLDSEGQRLDAARPLMQEFAASRHVTVTLWRKMGKDRIVLACSETSPGDLRIDMAVGQRLPILMGASGRLFSAHKFRDDKEMRAAFDKVRWIRPLSFDEYRKQVRQAQERGWAIDDGYFSAGVMAIAAPIYDRGGNIAFSVSAVTFRGQYADEEADKVGHAIHKLAKRLEGILF
jgi:DNA-binding IclR family transcriptional regulator